MRKLSILMLVLGMVSAANADLTWSVDEVTVGVGETVVVQLISDSDQPYTSQWVGADPSPVAEIINIVRLPAAGDGDIIPPPYPPNPYPGWWIVEAVDFTPPYDITAGPHFDVTIAGLSLGTYTINSDYGIGDNLLIIVPEPMTIAMLGLGGLFLLRRRK